MKDYLLGKETEFCSLTEGVTLSSVKVGVFMPSLFEVIWSRSLSLNEDV